MMITLTLTPSQFLYVRHAVERDMDEAQHCIMFGPDDDNATHAFNQARVVLNLMKDVEQKQVVSTTGGE
jgi:hypothetical protein